MPSGETPDTAASYCRFTASSNAAPLDGTASLGMTGIEIELGSQEKTRIWHYGRLKALEPVRDNAIDVLLTSRDEPGASLFVQGRDFAAGLKRKARHLSARADRLRRARPWLFLLALIAAVALACYGLGWSPLRTIAGTLPLSWRERLGDAARQSMTAGHGQCVASSGLAALDRLTARLSKPAAVAVPFTVRVYDWPLTNAFAVPGSQIILTKGLLDKSAGPDEVAGVLAHEMGHGIEMHPETGIIRNIGLAAAVEVMVGGGGLANVGLMLTQLGYSRSAERQADEHALELLKGAGIAPKGFADFFDRVSKQEGTDGSEALTWLRTHPSPVERARMVRNEPGYPSTPALNAEDWRDLKAICTKTLAPEKDEGS